MNSRVRTSGAQRSRRRAKVAARFTIAIAAAAFLVWRATATVRLLNEIDNFTAVLSINYNEAVVKALDLLVAQSTSWSQVALLLLGILAALWISKRDEVRLALSRDYWPEIVTWLVGVVLLMGSLYCHAEYTDGLAKALEAGGLSATLGKTITVPDVFSPLFDGLRREQLGLLVSGAIVSVAAPFSAWNLKELGDD